MSETLSPEQALSLIETCPIPLLALDRSGVIRHCNPAFADLVGELAAKQLAGLASQDTDNHPLRAFLGEGNRLEWVDAGVQSRHFEVLRGTTGGDDPLEIRYFIDITRQITLEQSQQALREELREQTLTDALTGLLNQRGVILALEPQVARSRRYNSPISVVVIDVHASEDQDALRKQVARLLKDQLRWADLVGCDKKQAFLLVLPETGEESALKLAEKLRARIDELAQRDFSGSTPSILYGVTGWRRTDNAATLLRRANQALEQARSAHHPHPVAL